MRIRVAQALMGLLAVCGCADRASDATPNASVGVGAPGPRDSGLTVGTDSITAELAFRIGELDGAPERAFGEIVAIAARRDSAFYVCDRNDTSIRLYDARGGFVRAIGRQGAGPAEYSSCHFLSIVGDSLLWVGDSHTGRFVGFGPDGTAAGVVRGGDYSNPQRVDPRGRFWWMRVRIDHAQGADHQVYTITDRSLTPLNSLQLPPRSFGESQPRPFALSTSEGSYLSVSRDTLWSISPDGALLRAFPTAYRVTRTGGSRPPLEIARDVAPVRVERAEHAEWEQWRAYMDEAARAGNAGRPVVHDPIPDTKPLLRAVLADDLGRIWAQVHVRAEKRDFPPRPPGNRRPLLTWRERNTFDLFDGESGGYIGRVAFPYGTELMTVRGDRVWLREEGESGEQRIGVYDLRPARRR
jgi:hypothetical protein